MQTVYEMLRRAAARCPEAPALVDPKSEVRLGYAELVQRVDRVAGGFIRHGVEPGDRVAVVLGNSIAAVIAILALHRANAVPVMLNPRLKTQQVIELAKHSGVAAAVLPTRASYRDDLRAVCLRQSVFFAGGDAPDDITAWETEANEPSALKAVPEGAAFVFFTSGTTGLPKGVVIPHRAAESRVLFMSTQVGYRHGEHNRILGAMPLYHVIGFFAVLVATLALNGRYVIVGEFKPSETLALIDSEEVTGMFVTPTHLHALLADAHFSDARLTSLQHITFAGATMPDALLNRINSQLPGEKVNIYGTTEAMNSMYARSPETGTVLRPGFFSEVRTVPIGSTSADRAGLGAQGELWVSTAADATFSEYLNRPGTTLEKCAGGWYRTGDAAVELEGGRFQLLGRVDDMIISGGENLHPSEIEHVVGSHPDVAEVAVVGIDDPKWGQKVIACIVPSGTALLSAEVLDEYCRMSVLADFKRPREYVFLDALPKSALNKVLRQQLVDSLNANRPS